MNIFSRGLDLWSWLLSLLTFYYLIASLIVSFSPYLFLSFTFNLQAFTPTYILLWLWNLIPWKSHSDGNHERRWHRRQKYIRQLWSSCRCTCDHNPTIVCAYTRAIIAHGGCVRRVESMTSCQSWNGNLAAKRGTSQLPATANNLGRSRSSTIHERVSTYAATIIENRRSIDEVFISGEETSCLRTLFPRLLFRTLAKLLTLTIKPICVSYLGVIETANHFVAESCLSYLLFFLLTLMLMEYIRSTFLHVTVEIIPPNSRIHDEAKWKKLLKMEEKYFHWKIQIFDGLFSPRKSYKGHKDPREFLWKKI